MKELSIYEERLIFEASFYLETASNSFSMDEDEKNTDRR
jgi:hypothetical protein